jgi:DNA-binding NarL/FixJ family response regulator
MLRVLLADDHPFVRQGTKLFLESQGMDVVGEATNGREAVEMTRSLHPDIVVMDVQMPVLSGIEAAKRIRHDHKDVHILALTAFNEPTCIQALLEAGVDGLVLKTAKPSEFYRALDDIAAGRRAFQPEQLEKARQQFSKQPEPVEKLSEREIEVLREAARGLTNKEIGRALFLSDRTIQGHLQTIYQKFGVATRTEAVTKALRAGLIDLEQEVPS